MSNAAKNENTQIALPDIIASLRSQLLTAQTEGSDSTLKFRTESIEIELQTVAKQSDSAEGGIAFWVLSGKGASGTESEMTQTIRLKLQPVNSETGMPEDVSGTGR